MFNIESASNKIGNLIGEELGYDEDKKSVIVYGLFSILQSIAAIIVTIILGAIFGVLIEGLIISFVIAILRKYSGGAHSSTPNRCIISGAIVTVILALISEGLLALNINLVALSFIIGVDFLYSYYKVYKLVPVDSPQKPIKNLKKIKELKKRSIVIITIYLIIVIAGIIFYYIKGYDRALLYSMCITLGIIWQVFTLTNTGHIVIEKIDCFLDTLFNRRKTDEKVK